MQRALDLTAILLLAFCGSCDNSAKPVATADARWDNTAAWIERQIDKPSSVAGADRTTPFYVDFYVPRLKQAADRLNLLREGKIDNFVVASYSRPVFGGWIVWVLWIPADAHPRRAVLSDAEGELMSLQVPLPQEEPNEVNFMHFEVFYVYVNEPLKLPIDDGRPVAKQFEAARPLNGTTLRIFDPSAPGDPDDETVPVVGIPGPDEGQDESR